MTITTAPKKRGRRPKTSGGLQMPSYQWLSLERESAALEQEAAALQERRNALSEKTKSLQIKSKVLFCDAVLEVAKQDYTKFMSVYTAAVRILNQEDGALVAGLIQATMSPSAATDENHLTETNETNQTKAETTDTAPSPAEVSTPTSEEKHDPGYREESKVKSETTETASSAETSPPAEEKPPQADQEKQPENAAMANQAPAADLGQDSGSYPQANSSKSADAPAPDAEENPVPADKEIPLENDATSDPESPPSITAPSNVVAKKRRSPSQDHLFSAPLPKRDVGVNSDEIPT